MVRDDSGAAGGYAAVGTRACRDRATGGKADRAMGAAMDETYLPILAIAIVVAAALLVVISIGGRRNKDATEPPESPFASSSEGMKVCPRCGMGNIWTDRNCVSCGTALRG